ncbi:zinc finger protein 800 isoform X2 [Ceratina calcarata]|uniref:Zinc finger protein 800 isoform X2 n=1 Tax=Ceratina calcarata TaxID=156304 RepID=A0AAJ7JGQ1_9HYME|nr:zinc finger protein 800 isoform X2 [Ceratina calcarata]
MKSMKAKTKAKKPNGKFGKVKFPSVEAAPDLSQLRPPIDTSISTLYRVTKLLESGSDEVKAILSYECDLMYECRICRSIFRSLINLISHKRVYCKEKFDITRHKFHDTTCIRREVKLELNNEQSPLDSVHSEPAVNETTESMPLVQESTQAEGTELRDAKQQTMELDSEVIQCNQQLNNNSIPEVNGGSSLNKIDIARENEHICPLCYEKFSTKKTLAVHTRTVHTSHRLCYPCPCCSVVFANTWSAYRHLYKVHKKTNEQVRKLRSQIQQGAFIKDTSPAVNVQKESVSKTVTNSVNDRINETQEWMDHLESDTELQRCGGCGKRFDRRVALLSHLQHCQMRIVAFEGLVKGKKMNKASSDSVQNGNTSANNWEIQNNVDARTSPASVEPSNSNVMPFRVETVASLSKDEWERLNNCDVIPQTESNGDVSSNLTNGTETMEDLVLPTNDNSNSLEIVYININKRKNNVGSKKRKNKQTPRRVVNDTYKVSANDKVNDEQIIGTEQLDYSQTMEKKLLSIVNFEKLQCLPCKQKFSTVNSVKKHAANHIGWNRFGCKLCDYKCFAKCDCVAHCNKVHNAQNNRVVLEDMIARITDDQFIPACDQNVSGANSDEEIEDVDMPEVVEVSIPADHMEPEVQIREESSETESIVRDAKSCEEESVRVNGETEENSDNSMKMGLDPEVKKMVLEVIFGPSEVDSMEQAEAQKAQQNKEDDAQPKEKIPKENDSVRDSSKPQRPIRKKMMPLNKDFIYDLKDLTIRKFPVILKPRNKPLSKKYAVQEEESTEKELEHPAKRFKSGHNGELPTIYENDIGERSVTQEDDSKDNLTSPQCHS